VEIKENVTMHFFKVNIRRKKGIVTQIHTRGIKDPKSYYKTVTEAKLSRILNNKPKE